MGTPNETNMEASGKLIMKSCRACHQILPLTSFRKDNRCPSGRGSYCGVCNYQVQLRYRASPRGRMLRNMYVRKRRALKLNLPHVAYTAQEIYDREQGSCHICKLQVDATNYHLDHVIPLQVPGDILLTFRVFENPGDVPWNVALAHPACNSSKGN